jgi:DNA-directed RNA polymerase subunit M/transcription elongation factor TFIIS
MFLHCRIEGCTRPVENQDTGLCATHGAEERKAQRDASKPVKNYSIPKRSKKGYEKEKSIQKTYSNLTIARHCGGCGSPNMLSHSHLLPRGQFPEFADHAENIVYDCIACHYIWEHGSWEKVQVLKDLKKRLRVCYDLAEQYLYRRFILKNPEMTIETLIKLM